MQRDILEKTPEIVSESPLRSNLQIATSVAASLLRAASGARVAKTGERPQQALLLFDFESCPFCRKAREALSILDLTVDVRPCPKGGRRFRETLRERGGKEQFPYLVDPNRGKELYESDAIVDYLFDNYGSAPAPRSLKGNLPVISGSLASLLRVQAGTFAEPSREPAEPLTLWSFEASPYCRLVREKLCTLEIPYRLHNVARGSRARSNLRERAGKEQVPYLEDPNTGAHLFESADILRYLEATYAA